VQRRYPQALKQQDLILKISLAVLNETFNKEIKKNVEIRGKLF
jgi:hypothetical protein